MACAPVTSSPGVTAAAMPDATTVGDPTPRAAADQVPSVEEDTSGIEAAQGVSQVHLSGGSVRPASHVVYGDVAADCPGSVGYAENN